VLRIKIEKFKLTRKQVVDTRAVDLQNKEKGEQMLEKIRAHVIG
jgi:hypothetical protein